MLQHYCMSCVVESLLVMCLFAMASCVSGYDHMLTVFAHVLINQDVANNAELHSQYEEDLNALEKELERKNKFLAEASENSARLELNLNFTREQLQIEKGQTERLVKSVGRLGDAVGLDMKSLAGPTLLSGRPRRLSSNERDTSADDGLESMIAVVQVIPALPFC